MSEPLALPTPVHEVPSLGLRVKDDSVIGGNKVRKLAHTIPVRGLGELLARLGVATECSK